MLERRLRLVLGVPGQMHLAVFADDRAVGPDQDGGIEAPALGRQFRIADIETDAELLRFVEKRLRLAGRHAFFEEPGVDFRLALHPPARKEGRERKFGKYDELRSHAVRFLQQILQSGNGSGAGVRLV